MIALSTLLFAGLTRRQKPAVEVAIVPGAAAPVPLAISISSNPISTPDKTPGAHDLLPPMKLFSPVACGTVRCQRENNEDSVRTLTNGKLSVAVLCDGLGGLPYGELASKAAANAGILAARAIVTPSLSAIAKLVDIAGQAVARAADARQSTAGYQTTFLAAALDTTTGHCAYTFCGDGEIYLRRANDRGLTRLIAPHHDDSGCLTSYLSPAGVEGQYSSGLVLLRAGDQLLLSSDGLAVGEVPQLVSWLCESINQRAPELSANEALQSALEQLEAGVDAQGQLAAHDNCTVAVLTMPGEVCHGQ